VSQKKEKKRAGDRQRAEQWRKGSLLVSTDPARLDLNLIYRFLTGCYWARGIPKNVMTRSIAHSLCFGVYAAGRQVGFARVISDFATYAYLGDVFVLADQRGRGVGKWLIECIMQHSQLQGLRRWSLVTRDAHSLYSQFGFTPLKSPDRHMEIHNPGVYSKTQKAGR
jgi:GNAT superfamily N-acetyltransferase